ncbi:hypothetical protein GH714_000276 [Hevea brasiliensis]|uniref:Uncharacterized protein n=1 Tax=Hevea brasiliensis TaxID=3981 RepID=A0A6A6L868_HEVBR|nr:hypothetical protein GH714_000276 [Hevea brasiliensis]
MKKKKKLKKKIKKMRAKRGEKSGDGAAKKEERLGEKLRRGALVGKRVGLFCCTPVSLWIASPPTAHFSIIANNQEEPSFSLTKLATVVSARKLAAAFWEFQHYLPLSKMHRGVHINNHSNGAASGDPRLRRHQNRRHLFKEKGLDLAHCLVDHSRSSPDQPESAGSLRRHIAASLIQHHLSIERSNHALQPVSPASYGSSVEVAPYNPSVTPSSSLDFRGRIGESHYSLKTSTELLKVLNRIWSLEEQHASNMSLIKALKTGLDHARVRIKELLRDQQAHRHEIDDLMKQIAEDKLVRKSKEQDRLHAAIQCLRDELEDEKKLRKRSESLHRKLARELSEVKSSLSNAVKEMEKERKSRKLLEDLCDQFAKGIKDYEQEMHVLKPKSDKDWVGRADGDHLILLISESWLDERMQMRLEEAQHGFAENNSIVEKLGFEIETFLKAKWIANSKITDNKLPRECRNSMESVPLNVAGSAPKDVGDEEDSASSDSHCFELNKPSNVEFNMHGDDAVGGHIDETVKSSQTKKFASGGNLVKVNKVDEIHGLNPNYVIDNLIRSHISSSEAGNVHHENVAGEASSSYPSRRNASPVRQWMAKLATPDLDISESSTKVPPTLKENTLKAKLLEARSKGPRAHLKLFRGSS